ncbi:uncharacterized protein LOC141680471 [Apium graveolens]|uniref:uncharacterized protein LOC141680471 n=1 Tax=Apium graveolens TaxID=4045 RepID=UPI003D790C4F
MTLDIMQSEEEEHEARIRMSAAYFHHRRQILNSISHHGGSTMNHRVVDRNREEVSSTFRMRRSQFLRIEEVVTAHDNYFTQRIDVVGVRGLSYLQKVTAALRMFAYGTAADAIDDYVRIGESTAIESLRKFVKATVEVFGAEYLRRPNPADVSRILNENER